MLKRVLPTHLGKIAKDRAKKENENLKIQRRVNELCRVAKKDEKKEKEKKQDKTTVTTRWAAVIVQAAAVAATILVCMLTINHSRHQAEIARADANMQYEIARAAAQEQKAQSREDRAEDMVKFQKQLDFNKDIFEKQLDHNKELADQANTTQLARGKESDAAAMMRIQNEKQLDREQGLIEKRTALCGEIINLLEFVYFTENVDEMSLVELDRLLVDNIQKINIKCNTLMAIGTQSHIDIVRAVSADVTLLFHDMYSFQKSLGSEADRTSGKIKVIRHLDSLLQASIKRRRDYVAALSALGRKDNASFYVQLQKEDVLNHDNIKKIMSRIDTYREENEEAFNKVIERIGNENKQPFSSQPIKKEAVWTFETQEAEQPQYDF